MEIIPQVCALLYVIYEGTIDVVLVLCERHIDCYTSTQMLGP